MVVLANHNGLHPFTSDLTRATDRLCTSRPRLSTHRSLSVQRHQVDLRALLGRMVLSALVDVLPWRSAAILLTRRGRNQQAMTLPGRPSQSLSVRINALPAMLRLRSTVEQIVRSVQVRPNLGTGTAFYQAPKICWRSMNNRSHTDVVLTSFRSSFGRRWSMRRKHPGPTPDDTEQPAKPKVTARAYVQSQPPTPRLAPVQEQSSKASLDRANVVATQSSPQIARLPPPEPKSRTNSMRFSRPESMQKLGSSIRAPSTHTGAESISVASSIKRRTMSLKGIFSRRSRIGPVDA